jgi:hypothetical protein
MTGIFFISLSQFVKIEKNSEENKIEGKTVCSQRRWARNETIRKDT